MRTTIFIRVLMVMVVLTGLLGVGIPVQAQGLGAQIIIRSTTFWEAVFNGSVNANRYERWSVQLMEAETFTVSVTTLTGSLTPDIYLFDASDNQLAMASGTLSNALLTTSQPAGEYYVQIQPQSGEGTYSMQITRTTPVPDPTSALILNPASVLIGATSTGTMMLANIPEQGYASAEFTCTYNPALISISNIVDAGLFGSDPAVAVSGPANGSFIFAVAGSNGQRAFTDGTAFTFTISALAAGEAQIVCSARVSTGAALTPISLDPVTLTITEPLATLAGAVLAPKPVTVTLYRQDMTLQATATPASDGVFSFEVPAGTYIIVASAPGYLKAQGTPVLTSGTTTTLQTVSLPAGDIDGNDVINQLDALTIGMNYNLADPAAADLNGDGVINVLDLEMLAANYNLSGVIAWQ